MAGNFLLGSSDRCGSRSRLWGLNFLWFNFRLFLFRCLNLLGRLFLLYFYFLWRFFFGLNLRLYRFWLRFLILLYLFLCGFLSFGLSLLLLGYFLPFKQALKSFSVPFNLVDDPNVGQAPLGLCRPLTKSLEEQLWRQLIGNGELLDLKELSHFK